MNLRTDNNRSVARLSFFSLIVEFLSMKTGLDAVAFMDKEFPVYSLTHLTGNAWDRKLL